MILELDFLNPRQHAAVQHQNGPAAIYAGPGSGKTRVVTLRAARLALDGKRTLVTTFTNDATEEMRARLKEILPDERLALLHVSTLHALSLQILKQADQKFGLLTDTFQQRKMAEICGAQELEGGVNGFITQMGVLKNQGQNSSKLPAAADSEEREFFKVWRAYEKAKEKKGLKEFDDLLLDALALLEAEEDTRLKWASRYDQAIVDECQDMNLPQYRLVFSLTKDHRNLMLVGDMDQSLYGFRGADRVTFRRFAEHPGTGIYELTENYRSTRSILTFANAVIRQEEGRHELRISPTRLEGAPVTWHRYTDADIEAAGIAAQIIRLHSDGIPYSDMAVLYRVNAQSEAFERIFAALGIPCAVREEGDFYARREIQGLLSYLNLFKTPEERPDEWLTALLNTPNRKISRLVPGQLANMAQIKGRRIWDVLDDFYAPDLASHRGMRHLKEELHNIEALLPKAADAGEALKIIRKETRFDNWLLKSEPEAKDNDRLQNIERMVEAAGHYATSGEYLEAVQKVRDERQRRKAEMKRKKKKRDEVTLCTGHSAKGLEWGQVFAAGWAELLLPHRKAEDIDEERRIAYVIATRARDRLALSSPENWNLAVVSPSRFLSGISLAELPEEERTLPEALPADAEKEYGGLFSL